MKTPLISIVAAAFLVQLTPAPLLAASANLNQRPADLVRSLTDLSYRDFDAQKGKEGLRTLKDAVSIYEQNAADEKENDRMYRQFSGISMRLKKCALQDECKTLLRRIVRAKMVAGFSLRTYYDCGASRVPFDAYTDLITIPDGSQKKELLEELLAEAKCTPNRSNVAYVLRDQSQYSLSDKEIENLEEIQKWQGREGNLPAVLSTMIRIADLSIHLDHYQQSLTKLKEATVAIGAATVAESSGKSGSTFIQTGTARKASFSCLTAISLLPGLLATIATTFTAKTQLAKVEEIYLDAYASALRRSHQYLIEMTGRDIAQLADKYEKSGDTTSSDALLNKALILSRTERDDSHQERFWLLRIIYREVMQGENAKAKIAANAYLASFYKPRMIVNKTTIRDTERYAEYLKPYGLPSEVAAFEKKQRELKAQYLLLQQSGQVPTETPLSGRSSYIINFNN